MRITGLEVQGFRGFAGAHAFDLDADAIVIVGANGQGKTSLFDAVLWGLTGKLDRIGDDDRRVVSMYSETGEARVRLDLRDSSNVTWRIARVFDGQAQQLRVERDGRVMEGQSAFTTLLEAVWPDALRTGDAVPALTAAITRSVYMQQDLVRQFVDADDEQQRFAAVGELVGAGRVTELQLQLEKARNAWSRATTQKTKERDAAQQRLSRLEDQLRRLGPSDSPTLPVSEQAWTEWWAAATEFGVDGGAVVRLGSPDAPRMLDSALRQLEVHRRSVERRRDDLSIAIRELSDEPPLPDADERTMRDAVAMAEHQRTLAQAHLAGAEARATAFRREQVALREQGEQLRALAQLALSHMGQHCPVCAQEHDVEATRTRLRGLLESTPRTSGNSASSNEAPDVGAAAEMVARCDRELANAQAALQRVSDAAIVRETWLARRERRVQELSVSHAADIPGALTRAVDEAQAMIERLAMQRETGERLSLALTKAAEVMRRADVERELEIARNELGKIQDMLASRDATSELANLLINALREAASDVVAEQLARIEPLLQRMYSGIDPHPSFRVVRLLTRFSRGRGHLSPYIEDSEASLSTDAPAAVLSSSQMNALAVSIFLALNLGVPHLPLEAVLLDDPLQSLDDVNLLGLVDLLRRVKDRRQIVVSTHDARFGGLLARKLRPGKEGQRTRLIELGSWDREGQSISQRDVHGDPSPLRIVA